MKIASWNVNSIRARLDHVTAWLKARNPDVLLLQELKGTEFPAAVFEDLGYESVAVTQKTYNGVAILSRHPIETISTALAGGEADSHARYLETRIMGIRVVNIYLPNGNPVGSDKFVYKLAWMDRLIEKMSDWRRENVPAGCTRIRQIPGIGPVVATAIVAAIGNGAAFRKGRDFAAWLGIVPRQYSTGGKAKLLGISKRGNVYLRKVLIHGARAAVLRIKRDRAPIGAWLDALDARAPKNVVVVAMANKLARIAWAVLSSGEDYRPTANAIPA
jgi:hypothetical protein